MLIFLTLFSPFYSCFLSPVSLFLSLSVFSCLLHSSRTLINTADPRPLLCLKGILFSWDLVYSAHCLSALFNVTKDFLTTHTHTNTHARTHTYIYFLSHTHIHTEQKWLKEGKEQAGIAALAVFYFILFYFFVFRISFSSALKKCVSMCLHVCMF